MSALKVKGYLNEVAEQLEIPDSAYEKAEQRYKDLGHWLCRDGSTCQSFSPHIFPQGSFRLGTAIKPLNPTESYDLDLACKLQERISKESSSQAALKELVGHEIELYRTARNIEKGLEEKKRCWRLEYADHINFHMDIVPCIPENETRKQIIKKAILLENRDEYLAQSVSELAVAITDNTLPNYNSISDKWNISNPGGYALWFESRMKLAQELLQERARLLKSATIEKIPSYQWKTPLQVCIQLLKRHRDQMFIKDTEVKPISIIITTLAAQSYQGETDLATTILNVLERMGSFIHPNSPRIPNPVNPAEDFTDKWNTEKGHSLKLEENFHRWLLQAKIDFGGIISSTDINFLTEQTQRKFAINLDKTEIIKKLGLASSPNIVQPKHHEITEKPRPWGNKQ
jgi:hypothetical protein